MAYRWHPKNAEVDADSPRAWGTCARCGMQWNLNQLTWQYSYQGAFGKLFGSMRADARTFPYTSKGCLACGHAAYNIAHMLRSCKSTRHLLNAWLRQVAPSVGAGRMTLNELDFVRSIFDFSSIPITKDRQATVNFVWDLTQTAIRSATQRRSRH